MEAYRFLGNGKNAASLKQIRAALSFAYKHWDLKNPFAKIEPRDLPLTTELSDSLGGSFAFLESFKGVRLRRGGGVNFAGSALVFSWPGRRAL